jgi:predicted membrane protein
MDMPRLLSTVECMSESSGSGPTWYVSFIGGLKRRGAWRMPGDMRVASILGGANLDLHEAELAEHPTLTKISLVGGVSLQAPHDIDINVEGFRLFGRVRIEPAQRRGTVERIPARTLRVREYSIIGGVHVER